VKNRKLMVIGLDCLTPQLVFEQWKEELPTLSRLMDEGAWGRLESTVPPITVPAWTAMMTGKDPGQLGFYGFRNRANYTYDDMSIANSRMVKDRTVWDILSEAGKKVVLIGIPQTYPPKPVNGYLITSFLTPSTKSQYTYPPELKAEVEGLVGEYPLDVENFRTDDKHNLLGQIYDMTEKHFKVARHLATTKDWDFFMLVEMGPDRIHHGFWKYSDTSHPKHQPGNPHLNAIRDYYRFLDKRVGELIGTADDDTVIIVVSDHGAQSMEGGLCINEWLMSKGYLHLKEEPNSVMPLERAEIDWSKTQAWGSGGYYGRLFLNVQGREPNGVIAPDRYEAVRDELIEQLTNIADDKGRPIGTRVFKPQDVYRDVKGIAPDLIVYFGNLTWRSVGSVGLNRIHTFENDTGPDDANHAQHGVFIMYDPQKKQGRQLSGLRITDCAATMLSTMGVDVPADMSGSVIT
jgi:predicted AlkP superfamily phosphohydrolase/phosphomutase